VTRPALKGLPVVVCHAKGDEHSNVGAVFQVQSTSEVASASYEAREFGIKNGMRYVHQTFYAETRSRLSCHYSLSQAKILCPEIQTVPYEFERFE
jgi:DNA repair protein REV1